jgi:hypothetical protein
MTLQRPTTFLAASLGAYLLTMTAHADIEYEFFLVTSFNSSYQLAETYVVDINENNVAIGTDTFGGFIWTESTGKIQTPINGARSINNLGYVAFNIDVYNSQTGEFTPVPPASAQFPNVSPRQINDNMTLVGVASHSGPACEPFNCPFDCGASLVWTPEDGSSHITNVPSLKPLLGVNNSNVAIGMIITTCDNNRGIVYDLDSGQWINLSDFLPNIDYLGLPAQTWPNAISDAGHVVGEATFGSEPAQQFIWTQQDGFTFLPAIPGGSVSYMTALGVNVHGQVVGRALDEVAVEWKAFIWDKDHGIRVLNTLAQLPANFIMNQAVQINDNGWIVGSGHFGPGWATQRGFVLKPINNTPTIPGDLNVDGSVDVADLIQLLAAWGECADVNDCPTDLDGSGDVGIGDLLILLQNWS